MELVILKGLNWGLSPMTPNAWMRMFMQVSQGDLTPYSPSFSLPSYSGQNFSKAMQLLDLSVLDLGSLEFTYSVLAASALYHTENEAVALRVSGYQWQDIAACVRWMSAFAFALRESGSLQSRFFPGIQPDDAHHIQSHSVDLDILARAQARLQDLATGGLRESPDPETHPPPPSGLDNTPQEGENDIMYPPSMTSHAPGLAPGRTSTPALLSPPTNSDIW
jgi:cyclin E